jgi:hypothetical protein
MRVSSPLLRTALPAPLRPLSRASLAPPPHAPAAPHRLASRLTPSAYTGTRRHAEAPADDEAPAPTADLTTTDPLEHYLAAVARGEVRRDEEQIRVMAKVRRAKKERAQGGSSSSVLASSLGAGSCET